jgi:hypothetical protein
MSDMVIDLVGRLVAIAMLIAVALVASDYLDDF